MAYPLNSAAVARCGDAFATPGKAKPLRRGGLDRHTVGINAKDFGHFCLHGSGMRADLRVLADQRAVDIGQGEPAFRAGQIGSVAQENL